MSDFINKDELNRPITVAEMYRLLDRMISMFDPPAPRVLLVEDDPMDSSMTIRLLEKFHVRVTAVSNGEAARDALKQGAFDYVLLDLLLPGLSGVELIKDLTPQPIGAGTHWIVLTGMPDSPLVSEALKLGGVYVKKPLTEEILKTFFRLKPTIK